jgi:hypothetical protein
MTRTSKKWSATYDSFGSGFAAQVYSQSIKLGVSCDGLWSFALGAEVRKGHKEFQTFIHLGWFTLYIMIDWWDYAGKHDNNTEGAGSVAE